MAGLQGAEFRLDPEERADEVFHVRRERHDQRGGLFGIERFGEVAGLEQFGAKLGIEVLKKAPVKTRETCMRGEVFKLEVEC